MGGFALFLLIIIILACAVKILFKYSIEASLFIVFCSITVLIAIAGLTGIIPIMLYFIYAIVAVASVYLVIYLIKNSQNAKKILIEIFTPGMVMFLLACILYYVVIWDKILIHDDEAGSWASQVKYMYETNTYKSFSAHGHIIGFFTFFVLKLAGYHESMFFVSLWTFKWAALALTMRGLKWDKWYKALIFSVGAFGIINILPDFEPAYYMDVVLGLLAGSICASWSLKSTERKDFVWLYLGLIVLVNIKDELGTVIAVLTSLFCIFSYLVKYYMKPEYDRNFKFTDIILIFGILITSLFFAFRSPTIISILKKIISMIGYTYFIAAVGVFTASIFVIVIFRKKVLSFLKKRINAIIIVSSLLLVAVIFITFSLAYSKLTDYSFQRADTLLLRLWNEPFFNKPTYALVLLSVILIALSGLFLINKAQVKSFVAECSFIIISIPLYAFALFIGYMVTTGNLFDHFMMNGFTRYYSGIILLASVWFLAKMTRMESEYKVKHGYLISSLLLVALFIFQIPAPGNIAFSNLEHERHFFTYKLRPDIKTHAEFIKEKIEDEKLLIICSTDMAPWDPFTAALWLSYEITPMETGSIILTGDKEYMFTNINREFSNEQLLEYIRNGNYTYVYFYSKNEFIDKKYSELMDFSDADSGVLYKVTPDAQHYLSLFKTK